MWEAATQSTSYYNKLASHGLAPRRLRSLVDLESVPLLTKQDVRQLRSELFRAGEPPTAYRVVTTGGTTGEPLELRVSHTASASEWALMLHAWKRAGFESTSSRAVLRGVPVRGRHSGRRAEFDGLNRALILSGFDLRPDDMDLYLRLMKRHRVDFLHAYPSTTYVLAQHILATGATAPDIRGVLLGSETIHDWQTKTISSAFGAPVFSWYGHTEKCVFAAECEAGQGYHPSPLYGYVELVDDSGDVIHEPGVRGVIVGTSFINLSTALVRYVTDDEAEWQSEPCPCGRAGWRLVNVVGHRGQEMLVGKNGAPVSVTTLHGIHDKAFAHVLKYQFRQCHPGTADFLYVKSPTFTTDHERVLRDVLTSRLSGTIDLRIVSVSDIAPTASGKHRFVDQRIPGVGDLGELRVGEAGNILANGDSERVQ